MEYRVALALTADGSVPNDHFGQADHYGIFSLSEGGLTPLDDVPNPFFERHHDHDHDDHESGKTRSVVKLLAQQGVQVVVSRQFGQNVRGLTGRFVVIVVNDETVDGVTARLVAGLDRIASAWDAGDARKPLALRRPRE